MPRIPNATQLRALLPYAARLLPLLTGAAPPAAAPPELGTLHRNVGEIHTESRSLRTEVAGQSEQIAQIHARLDRLAAILAAMQESTARQQTEDQATLAGSLRSLSTLLKGVSVAMLLLLLAVAVMCGLLLHRAG